jgi:predicted DNA-binding transcriptional regulator AlpA
MVREADPPSMATNRPATGSLMSVDDVARLLNVSPKTVRSWRRSGRLPRPLAIAGVIRWRSCVIEAWLRAHEDVA